MGHTVKKFRRFQSKGGPRFVQAEIEVTDRNGYAELSICGTEGRIVKQGAARKEAREYWISYFQEDRDALGKMAIDYGTRTAASAARKVVEIDGKFHGLDVDGPGDGPEVRIVESCGQIVETLTEQFPELAPVLPWHLNGMNAGCTHQRALGWGRGKEIAITCDRDTPAAQAHAEILAAVELWRRRVEPETFALLTSPSHEGHALRKAIANLIGEVLAIGLDEALRAIGQAGSLAKAEAIPPRPLFAGGFGRDGREALAGVRRYLESKQPREFPGRIYADSLSAPCPVCGYRYGSAWLRDELPAEIVAWVGAGCPLDAVPVIPRLAG